MEAPEETKAYFSDPPPVQDRKVLPKSRIVTYLVALFLVISGALVTVYYFVHLRPHHPSQILNLDSWQLVLPTTSAPPVPPTLYSDDLFALSPSLDAAMMKVPCNGIPTLGSSLPRTHLLELANLSKADWSAAGNHKIHTSFRVMKDLEISLLEIHNYIQAEVLVIYKNGNLTAQQGDEVIVLDNNLPLDTKFDLDFVIDDGELKTVYNEAEKGTLKLTGEHYYFRVGVALKAVCKPDEVGEVWLSSLDVNHSF